MAQPPRAQKFRQDRQIVDPKTGYPTTEFLRNINNGLDLLNYLASIQAAADAANAAAAAANVAADNAQGAADNAQAASDATAAETSLVNSFVTNFTGASVITATNTGDVTIKNHDRQYGDTTLNPTVAVTGATLVTGLANPSLVRVYYDDASRAGGGVTYAYTVDPADPPIQGGDRHVVGAVTIPAAGTSDGGWVRPPGYTGATP